ncbi:TonB-dependent receptor domain-containing protein [Sphingomonas hengshuiensis]|uniref:TonB-dependent receptor-like beta-barrel domain-containing protein n=1 Tax=Sphingomonas hengshuiensis TaxID=1609977 RepID=A0A7U4J6Y6_9SPHN|nr:TonB-dependent receptor [Sphingomonas hengshuiensis]AJP71387.1 hypothetical protein TS85_05760 [Sphingomonas hengshuiensis]
MSSLATLLASLAAMAGTMEDCPEQSSPKCEEPPRSVTSAGSDPAYPAEFYTPFQPQTALEMLERTPGFPISDGSGVRGFGGAAGNVLIDGQRPTVKAGGISEVLRRIPSARVARIVLLRGSDAAEAQGQTLVANVILKTDARGAGTATLTLARAADGGLSPTAKASYAKAIGAWQTSVELMAGEARYPSNAQFHNLDAAGALTLGRLQESLGKAPEYGVAASASRPLGGGTLTVNLRLNHDIYSSATDIGLYAGEIAGAPYANRFIAYREESSSGELGLDWTRGLGTGWTLKLVGLGQMATSRVGEEYQEPAYRGVSDQRQKPLELIGRVTLARQGDHAIRPELGVEMVYNRLISHLDYAEDTGQGMMPVALSNANTRVSEQRGEAFANVAVRLARRLELEAGGAFELSRLTVKGDSDHAQSLSYFKPSAALVWSPRDSTQLRLAMRRTVDQLDFGDFAASVDQADGRPMGGNSGLRPARVTRVFLRLDHRWGKGAALALETYHQWHKGLLGYLVLDTGDEALGTIGDARQWGLTGNATLPLHSLLKGARITVSGTLRDSRFRDPLTGEFRAMDDLPSTSFEAEFRHDLPRLRSSWGFSYTSAQEAEIFYTGERLFWRERPVWNAFVETTAVPGFKTTLRASAITGEDSDRLRRFFSPNRAGDYSGKETRKQTQGATISLTLSRAL